MQVKHLEFCQGDKQAIKMRVTKRPGTHSLFAVLEGWRKLTERGLMSQTGEGLFRSAHSI
jgi:hypothetical protein